MIQVPADSAAVSSAAVAARNGLFIALGIATAGYLAVLAHAYRSLAISVVGFIANFLDTLGIGSFATTTTMVRQFKLVPDELLPGTLNVGYAVPTIVQAYIYMQLVPVDPTTLIVMIGAAVLGAWLGAGVVSRWPRRNIQMGIGTGLLVFAVIMFLGLPQIGLLPSGGTALGLTGPKLALGALGNFILGALMPVGIGLYAPCMILIYLLGMHPTAAFPIMMGSCAFLMPLSSVRFIRAGAFARNAVIGMLVAAIPAVFIAALIVKSLPLEQVKWLVLIVVTYAAFSLLRAAKLERSRSTNTGLAQEAANA